jgi:hypothetical protein
MYSQYVYECAGANPLASCGLPFWQRWLGIMQGQLDSWIAIKNSPAYGAVCTGPVENRPQSCADTDQQYDDAVLNRNYAQSGVDFFS